ncbi:2-dehydro-3-deoxygalactonokinase (plasmid) [Klebsiella aerogenes]|uniref:2-dehydro-3-deoxygalactonokinase n=1 Tax=Klebsiella aerogenes TaxID=548 RepID=UPI00124F5CC0|nr:2-dehydro-3-deoxygalactonokinase [Klebsiella aerogenes]QFI19860.1 2-dehydro-3-deoxygalactonokinase [Klebsiella aerogenes]
MFSADNYIAVDWGSSNLRLWVWQDGECVWQYASAQGVTRQKPGGFSDLWQTLLATCPVPLAANTQVIMSGMIGSNMGWVNAPYLTCPTAIASLADHLTVLEEAGPFPVFIVPGLQLPGPDTFNVMRGEETQLYGALGDEHWYVFPGTHSKWVSVENGMVRDFQTIMTGELFHLLSTQSVLRLPHTPQQECDALFLQGAQWGAQETCLSRGAFLLRSRMLCNALDPTCLHSALSGFLIGHEIARMQNHYRITPKDTLVLIGSDSLLARYQTLIHQFGLTCRVVKGDAAFLAGIRSILHAHD